MSDPQPPTPRLTRRRLRWTGKARIPRRPPFNPEMLRIGVTANIEVNKS